MSYTEGVQKIANDYMASGKPWPATKIEIAQWALTNERWQPQPALTSRSSAQKKLRMP